MKPKRNSNFKFKKNCISNKYFRVKLELYVLPFLINRTPVSQLVIQAVVSGFVDPQLQFLSLVTNKRFYVIVVKKLKSDIFRTMQRKIKKKDPRFC